MRILLALISLALLGCAGGSDPASVGEGPEDGSSATPEPGAPDGDPAPEASPAESGESKKADEKSLEAAARAFFRALASGQGFEEYWLTEAEIQETYSKDFAKILGPSRAARTGASVGAFQNALAGGEALVGLIEVSEIQDYDPEKAARPGPIMRRATVANAARIHCTVEGTPQEMELEGWVFTARGWRFLLLEYPAKR